MRTTPPFAYLKLILASDLSQPGWLLFGFGMIFVWIFGIKGDYRDAVLFLGSRDSAVGTITRVEEGFGEENESEIWAFSYSFVGPEGNQYPGLCYSAWHRFKVGEQVTVEFPAGKPTQSRIVGTRRAQFPALAAISFFFPALGLYMIARGFARGRKAFRLLQSGKQAQGKLESDLPDREGGLTNYQTVFSFMTDTGRILSMRQKVHVLADLEDKCRTLVIYAPDNPSNAVLVETVPGRPYVNENDEIVFKEPMRLWAYLLLPTICILGHSVWAYLLIFGPS
jgi:hypothetical protein